MTSSFMIPQFGMKTNNLKYYHLLWQLLAKLFNKVDLILLALLCFLLSTSALQIYSKS